MGIFINVIVDSGKCKVATGCTECISICPVDIFFKDDHTLKIKDEDECTLCYQCTEICPESAIEIVKNY